MKTGNPGDLYPGHNGGSGGYQLSAQFCQRLQVQTIVQNTGDANHQSCRSNAGQHRQISRAEPWITSELSKDDHADGVGQNQWDSAQVGNGLRMQLAMLIGSVDEPDPLKPITKQWGQQQRK